MRFVEHHGVVLRQNAALMVLVAQGEVGEEKVVVDDDDVAFHGALVHQGDEAALVVGTFGAGAHVGAGIHLGPGCGGLRQSLDFGAVAELRGLLPFADDFEVGAFFEPREDRLLFGVVDLLAAGVVVAPLHVADLQGPRKVLLEEGDVLEEELFLEILGACGDDDALTGQQGRDQVRQGFSGTGAGLHDEVPLVGKRRFHGFGHFHLTGAELVIGMPLGQRAVPGKELPRACWLGLSGHRLL